MPEVKISAPQRQVLDTLAAAGGVMRRIDLRNAVWRATSRTIDSLLKRDLLVGIEPGPYPVHVQLTDQAIREMGIDGLPAVMAETVRSHAEYEHERRYPTPRTFSTVVPVRSCARSLTVANDGPQVVLTTYTTGPIVFTTKELQDFDQALSLARSAAATHRPAHTARPAPKVVG